MRASRAALLLLGTLVTVVAGCRPTLHVSLASQDERLPSPRFVVEDPEHSDRPRYNTVQVLDRDGSLYWQARAEPFGDTQSGREFTYGTQPQGFEAVEGPRELQPGGRYALFVVGTNRGSLHFDVDAEGRVHAVPP